MLINNYEIHIFNPEFALNRIMWPEPLEGEYSCLNNEISRYPLVEKKYSEGDEIFCRERDYHKYPDRIAVVFETENAFKMQTFIGGKVGKLYDDILKQANEIRPFFDCGENEILVLENRYGRSLPKNIDLIVKYIKAINKANSEYASHQGIVNSYVMRYNQIIDEKNRYIGKKAGKELRCIEELTNDFLEDIFTLIDSVNYNAFNKIKRFFEPVSNEEKRYITFGLYYCFLKKGLGGTLSYRRSVSFGAFLHEMHKFISENPKIVEEYCNYMDYPNFERRAIEQILEKEGLTRDRWIFAADDLL